MCETPRTDNHGLTRKTWRPGCDGETHHSGRSAPVINAHLTATVARPGEMAKANELSRCCSIESVVDAIEKIGLVVLEESAGRVRAQVGDLHHRRQLAVMLRARRRAGDSVKRLAKDYAVDESKVAAVVEWDGRQAA